MAISHRQNRILQRPDKEYFELWQELGTLDKVSKHLALLGEINPRLKQPYSSITIRTAALRYVIEFPDEAKASFDKEYGRVLPQKEWDEYLVRFACSIYDTSANRLRSWIERKGMQKYDYIYSKRFPNGVME